MSRTATPNNAVAAVAGKALEKFVHRPMERILLTGASVVSILSLFGSASLWIGISLAIGSYSAYRLIPTSRLLVALITGGVSAAVAAGLLASVDLVEVPPSGFWLQVAAAWLLAWACVEQLAAIKSLSRAYSMVLNIVIPVIFGVWLLILWELFTRGLNVPQILLPSPSLIAERFTESPHILWADFKQTFLKAVLIGYVLGCGSGFVVAILIDRSPFLQRGLLPIGNLVSALPIVGVAPIMVMWFGFDWPSKAAVVVIMTFFPMLVNTVAGLSAASPMQHDLMNTYAANYWQRLFKLRLPEALPFIFNALKINSTLAMIGAIVAEFFGTPTVGMGFRISTEVGRMNVDMVWAEIAVAALAGSLFYGVVALAERVFTFWHPSNRS